VIGRTCISACALLLASPLGARSVDDEFPKNVVASFAAGDWRAQSADFQGYTYSPQFSCRMFVDGAMLIQTRPRESGRMDADWSFLNDRQKTGDNFEIKWIQVNETRYQAAVLPWRLVSPPPDGIVLTFDLTLLAVRRDAASEWLPAAYLTLPLIEAKRLEIGFQYEVDDRVVQGSKKISLNGFKAVSKWCGRELLRDRQDQPRVQELTK